MEDRPSRAPCDSKEVEPDDAKLKIALGKLHAAYEDIVTWTRACRHEWKFFGKRYGWQLKAARKGKALFYLASQEKSFRVGFSVREKELLLTSKLPRQTKEELTMATRKDTL